MSAVVRNAVTVRGAGPGAIIFAHGFGCDQNMWRDVEPLFQSEWSTIAFDHIGAGRSDLSAYDPEKYASLAGYADDLVELCQELQLERPIFVGHSVSAVIGVLALRKRPDLFGKIVLICPSPRYSNTEGYFGGFEEQDLEELTDLLSINQLEFAKTLAPVVMGNPDRPELTDDLAASFCRTDPVIARDFARATFHSDHRADLSFVTAPTLIIECQHDSIAPPEVAQFVHCEIAGSVLVTLSATGHCPHVSAPAETAAAIRAFVQ